MSSPQDAFEGFIFYFNRLCCIGPFKKRRPRRDELCSRVPGMFLQGQGREQGQAGKPAGPEAGPAPPDWEGEGRALDSSAVPRRFRSSWWEVGEPKPAVGGGPPRSQERACVRTLRVRLLAGSSLGEGGPWTARSPVGRSPRPSH